MWLRGGFPESYLAIDLQTSFLNRTSFLGTYIERELPLLGFTNNQRRIADILVRMLAHVHGNLINYADLSRSIGVGQQRVKDIIAYFEQSYLVRLLPPFHTNSGKRLVKRPKM
ncbi:MAG: DUF4143 domain-containing protein [Bacteroidota bacterium]|nr:DUF4143 domain-containing protein [Bacteroidota bacterium]